MAVAVHTKSSIYVTNDWLEEKLDMGSGVYVSKPVGLARRAAGEIAGCGRSNPGLPKTSGPRSV